MNDRLAGRAAATSSARSEAHARVSRRLTESDVQRVRIAWADLHGATRCKTVSASAALRALDCGIAFVGTPLLKDTSDRTALKVFDAAAAQDFSRLANAANILVVPDPETFVALPWSPGTFWMLGDSHDSDGGACEADPRHVLAAQSGRLLDAGYRLRCGLEVEFHVYRIRGGTRHLDPERSEWPGPAPEVELLHSGYRLLSEESADASHEVLGLIESTAIALGLPLISLEVEFGPSQFEAVFDVLEAAEAADAMVLFRSAVRQVLARHGYHATFMCRPPFPSVMSSGWHLHQSLLGPDGRNVFAAATPAGEDRGPGLSGLGQQWLAGLMSHALGSCLLGTPTANGYARYQPNALAPTRVRWGRDDRSALFRIVGQRDATRIENRLGEPSANPYLYIASQIISGLEGLNDGSALTAVEAGLGDLPLPASLGDAIATFKADLELRSQLGSPMCQVIDAAKASEWTRFTAATDPVEFQRREYFARF